MAHSSDWLLANSRDKCIFFIRISYLTTTVNSCIGPTTKEKQSAPITDGQLWTMQFYFGIVVLSSIAIFESLSLIYLHHTILCYIIFYSMSVVKICVYMATA